MDVPARGESLNSQNAGRTNQRARLLVLMAAIMLIGVIGQSVLLRSFLQNAFDDIEQGQLQANLKLAQRWLDRTLDPMRVLPDEIGRWPELHAVLASGDTTPLRARLDSVARLDLGADVFVVIDAQNRIRFAGGYDRRTREEVAVPDAVVARLSRHARTLLDGEPADLAGWTAVGSELFASALHRVTRPDGQQVVVAVGRDFTAADIASMDDFAGTYSSVGLEPPAAGAHDPARECVRLSPSLNEQAQFLCVRLQVPIAEAGMRSSQDLRVATLAGVVLLMLGTWLFIDRSLLARLTSLTRKLEDAAEGPTEVLEEAMLADGRRGDELGTLSLGMGRMLGRVREAETGLKERERSFRALAESTGVAIFVFNKQLLYTNPFASRLTGYAFEELQGRPVSSLVHPDWRVRVEDWLRNDATRNTIEGREILGQRKDGTTYWARLHATVIEYHDSPALLVTLYDISEQRHLEAVLASEKQNLQAILCSIHDGIVSVDAGGIVRFLNPAAERLTGIPLQLANGSPLQEVLYLTEPNSGNPLKVPLIRTTGTGPDKHTLAQVTTPQGLSSAVELSVWQRQGDAVDGNPGAVIVMRDVSDLRQLTQVLSEQAAHDDLTSLINRREFSRRLDEALALTRRTQRPHALCYLDLDQFKLLNDTCGHHAGDLMLREIADALRHRVRASDTLARLGGDEFGVLLNDCPPERAVAVANSLRDTISKVRFQFNGQNFSVDASVGVTMLEHVEGNVDAALALADAACYMAKDLGRNRVHLYQPADTGLQQQLRHMRWATRLKEAVEQSQFRLYAQPVHPVAPHSPPIVACEALVRMRQPDGSIATPEEFLAAAERYQMMDRIDRWVVSKALESLSQAGKAPNAPRRRLFINLSGQSLGDERFCVFLLAKLDEYQHLAGSLVFEVTETAIISSLSRAKKLMEEMHARGCQFALDDFGTGMSSFSYLKEMRVDYLKIAGCFVRNAREPLDAAVCRSFTDFARMLNITAIAEEIEDPEVLAILADMGVDYGQGWHFGRPAPIEQLLGLPEII
ncbi:MAG TPA: EAL domain-containing protein [Nevskiaceae bacterium]|nr:EAL domain-containing protein [Nevskiaceae bacterium]